MGRKVQGIWSIGRGRESETVATSNLDCVFVNERNEQGLTAKEPGRCRPGCIKEADCRYIPASGMYVPHKVR